ncbi:metal ABC transporter permease [Venenivibrio stagnispumantis]|uniref:Zinc transport system permease protein n=2 Tax=Venenivibrio stagnispumantis TaxID=407998 RepID=A0AA46AFM5_9AQUI|nr:metal ABC transporter permease [Venenivibrio stagnispumantis]SMP20715.1 zinc transport system permease protein [Venenivibrio stagnispumantis]
MELLDISFIRNAIIGGVLLSLLLSVLSLFIVIKKWSFINIGISHAAFGGLAIGFVAGISPSLTGSLFAVFIGLLIGYISKKGNIHEDISIGILLSMSMALGVIVITFAPNYNSDLFAFLFGNILTITDEDIYILLLFSIFTFIFLWLSFKKILYCCFDEELAYISGINTNFYYYMMITILAIATVLSIKLVGTILSSAMMILPAAVSSQIFWHYKKILISSVIISLIMVLLGIFVSFEYNLPSGATIVLIYSIVFFIVFIFRKIVIKD